MTHRRIKCLNLSVDFAHRGHIHQVTKIGETGLMLIDSPRFVDPRGTFMETFSVGLFEKIGLPSLWLQDNLSTSKRGVIRGMHIQSMNCQGKLIQCVSGTIQDVAVDVRPGSPTRGQHFSTLLGGGALGAGARLFYIPPGFAHGFLALEDSVVSYKCTTEYVATADGGVNPMGCGIAWMVERDVLPTRISQKDQALPSLMDYLQRHE